MKSVLAFCVLVIAVTSHYVEEDCHRGMTDGCSVPFWLPRPYIHVFTESCHKHDQCYGCGSHKWYALDRKQCDDIFLINLQAACNNISLWKRFSCYIVKGVYYAGVRIAGKHRYRTQPREWCEKSWVKNCLV